MQVSAEVVRRGLPRPVGVGVRHLAEMGNAPPALFAQEEAALGPRAVQQRRVLFALGRAAARDALAELGVAAVPIGRGADGAPAWPAGVVGAISHSHEVAIAVAGWRSDYVGLGVDVEELGRGVRADIARLVCRPEEMEWVDVAGGMQKLIMLFSAKEAVFKALYPIERVWLGFEDAELTWQPERGSFLARVLKRFGEGYPEGFELQVNCTVGATWVLTSAFVPTVGV